MPPTIAPIPAPIAIPTGPPKDPASPPALAAATVIAACATPPATPAPVPPAIPPKLTDAPFAFTPVTPLLIATDFALLNIVSKTLLSNVTPLASHMAFAFLSSCDFILSIIFSANET